MNLIKSINITRDGVFELADSITDLVKSGEMNPLELSAKLKALEEATKIIRKQIHESLMSEAEKYPEKTFQAFGMTFTKAEHGTKYDFTVCGSHDWESLTQEIDILTAKRKKVEEFLKALSAPIVTVDEETGEAVRVRPPSKTSTAGINHSIK